MIFMIIRPVPGNLRKTLGTRRDEGLNPENLCKTATAQAIMHEIGTPGGNVWRTFRERLVESRTNPVGVSPKELTETFVSQHPRAVV